MAILDVPERFRDVAYVAARIPGVPDPENLAAGANCQLFAYELLRHHGRLLPPFRSSELWDDEAYTMRVTAFEPLDLMLYHHEPRAFGAHVGVYLGDDQVIHLSKDLGRPAIQPHASFAASPKYAYFIGAKRVRG